MAGTVSNFGIANLWRGVYGMQITAAYVNVNQVFADATRRDEPLIGVLHCWKTDGKWNAEYETVEQARARLAKEVQGKSTAR